MSETLIVPTEIGFAPVQRDVLEQISLGHTGNQAARELGIPIDDVVEAKAEIEFMCGSLTVGVNQAIRTQQVEIDVNPDAQVIEKIQEYGCKLIKFYAQGGSNGLLQKRYRRPAKKVRDTEKNLFLQAGAWNRPHLTRRGYELGILSLANH